VRRAGDGRAFCLFEALRGWCVARACGVKRAGDWPRDLTSRQVAVTSDSANGAFLFQPGAAPQVANRKTE